MKNIKTIVNLVIVFAYTLVMLLSAYLSQNVTRLYDDFHTDIPFPLSIFYQLNGIISQNIFMTIIISVVLFLVSFLILNLITKKLTKMNLTILYVILIGIIPIIILIIMFMIYYPITQLSGTIS
jgi:hypothetical protein